MHARLISYTTTPLGIMAPEQLIAYCARVSNPQNQSSHETADKLLRYLIDHKHWSPFEMVNVCMEVKTTRDIARQMLRHRSFSFQEFSQRYADPTELGYVFREARLHDPKNRQNSIEGVGPELQQRWDAYQNEIIKAALDGYKWAREHGIAKEVARALLPEGMIESVLYMNGSVRSWIHYLDVRTDPSTQKEHRQVALECAKILIELMPSLVKKEIEER